VKPKRSMLSAIWRSCLFGCLRAFRSLVFKLFRGRYSIFCNGIGEAPNQGHNHLQLLLAIAFSGGTIKARARMEIFECIVFQMAMQGLRIAWLATPKTARDISARLRLVWFHVGFGGVNRDRKIPSLAKILP